MRHWLAVLSMMPLIASAQSVPSVLVIHDMGDGYGDAVLQAIDELWPSCEPVVFCDSLGIEPFNNALANGVWDVVIIERWITDTSTLDWPLIQSMYEDDQAEFFIYCWFWLFEVTDLQFECYQSMGVEDLIASTYNFTPQVWEPDHPLVQGISDWSQYGIFPGGGSSVIRNTPLLCGNALPVIGWLPGGGVVTGGICVAEDGESIISGYCPAYSYEGVAIWKNILYFLWDGNALEPVTWAEIKSQLP